MVESRSTRFSSASTAGAAAPPAGYGASGPAGDFAPPLLRANNRSCHSFLKLDSVFLGRLIQQVHPFVSATAVRFYVTHRALTEMRLVTTVALKRRRNHTPSHADSLLERKPRPAPAGRM